MVKVSELRTWRRYIDALWSSVLVCIREHKSRWNTYGAVDTIPGGVMVFCLLALKQRWRWKELHLVCPWSVQRVRCQADQQSQGRWRTRISQINQRLKKLSMDRSTTLKHKADVTRKVLSVNLSGKSTLKPTWRKAKSWCLQHKALSSHIPQALDKTHG